MVKALAAGEKQGKSAAHFKYIGRHGSSKFSTSMGNAWRIRTPLENPWRTVILDLDPSQKRAPFANAPGREPPTLVFSASTHWQQRVGEVASEFHKGMQMREVDERGCWLRAKTYFAAAPKSKRRWFGKTSVSWPSRRAVC
jgi:hypothetical protein